MRKISVGVLLLALITTLTCDWALLYMKGKILLFINLLPNQYLTKLNFEIKLIRGSFHVEERFMSFAYHFYVNKFIVLVICPIK